MQPSTPSWQSLRKAAERARQGVEHQQAIDLYTQALAAAGSDAPWEDISAMVLARADTRAMLGQNSTINTELTALAEQAAERGDDAIQSTALAELAIVLRLMGELERGLQVSKQSLQLAQSTGKPDLIVAALFSVGMLQSEIGEFDVTQETLAHADALLAQSDTLGQIKISFLKGIIYGRLGDYPRAMQNAELAVQLARQSGRRDWEAASLNVLSNSTTDLARRGRLLEQALTVCSDIGDGAVFK